MTLRVRRQLRTTQGGIYDAAETGRDGDTMHHVRSSLALAGAESDRPTRAECMTDQAADAPRVLYTSDFYVLSLEPARGAALLRRSPRRFADLAVLRAENERIMAKLSHCDLTGIVIDMRLAPPNNDDSFEMAMEGLRGAVRRTFARVVVLVASAVGELQINRLGSRDSTRYHVTRDPSEAFRLAAGTP